MHPQVERQVLRRGQGVAGRRDALNDGVVREVPKHHQLRPPLRQVGGEGRRVVVPDPDAGEHDREVVGPHQLGLGGDLDGQTVVRQAVAREDGQLLSANEGHQHVDRREPRVDEVPRIETRHRVYGLPVDVALHPAVDGAVPVQGAAQPVEGPPEDVRRERDLEGMPQEPRPGRRRAQPLRPREHLHHHRVLAHHDDAPHAGLPSVGGHLHDLVVANPRNALQQDNGPLDTGHPRVLRKGHALTPPP